MSLAVLPRLGSTHLQDRAGVKAPKRRLHLGCGYNILKDWINLDHYAGAGIDVVADLDQCNINPLPFENDSIDEFFAAHVFEHIRNPLPMMQELHRIARPGAKAIFVTPYGSSDDAFEDPTHVRQCFIHTFAYFSQPFLWRADYGYRGDWEIDVLQLKIQRKRHFGKTTEQMMNEVMSQRNVVLEMCAILHAIKPIRPPDKELQKSTKVEFILVD